MTPDAPLTVFGPDGEPCPSCHAPLAGNQRYCLYCGTRRPEARLEFVEAFAVDAAVPGAALLPPRLQTFETGPEPGLNGWLKARSGLLGLAGLLAVTLLIGLLLGHWASGSSAPQAAAAAPQVIRVSGGTGATDTTASAAADTSATDATASKSKKTKSKKAASGAADAAPVTSKVAVAASKVTALKGKAKDKALGNLAKQGKGLATGGAPPPKDNKAAGGGSSFESIG